jgi:hypothetical protein
MPVEILPEKSWPARFPGRERPAAAPAEGADMRLTTKTDRLTARYIPPGAVLVMEHDDGSACYHFERAGKLYAIGYTGTAGRPTFHYSFRDADRRWEYCARWRDGITASHARKATERATKAAWTNPLVVGALLATSWGYDQTNVNFYAVTKVSGRRVWLREVAQDSESTGSMSANVWPRMPIECVGPETWHVAQPSGEGAIVKVGHHYASPIRGGVYHSSSYA